MYEADWNRGFEEFMFLMAEQYGMELMIEAGNPPKRIPSPTVQFWREEMQGLSPMQMRQGLKDWMKTNGRGFKPTPEDIRTCAQVIQATDKPLRKKDPNCEMCGGTGWQAEDGRKYAELTGHSKCKMVRCDCSVIVYKDHSYKPPKELQPAPDDKERDGRLLAGIVRDARIDRRKVAVMPKPEPKFNPAPPMTDAEMERQKRIIAEKYSK